MTFPAITSVALFSPGDMGHAVGAVIAQRGMRVVTSLTGRSALSCERASRAGLEDMGSLEAALSQADLVLSIMPPSEAEAFASQVAACLKAQPKAIYFADCNAVAPTTAQRMAVVLEAAGATFIDASIIGGPPRRLPDKAQGTGPRFYASGASAETLLAIHGRSEAGEIDVRPIGDEVGRASGIKMVYAGLTKGTMTLHAAVLIAAERMGLLTELSAELQASQGQAWGRMGLLPFLPADAERWIGEMSEVAEAFRSTGAPGGFHEAAEEIFRIMAATPYANETRETLDRSRSLETSIRTFAAQLDGKD